MKPVITGSSKITSKNMYGAMDKISSHIKQMRFVHDLELLTVAAVGNVLTDAGIHFPVGDSSIGIYIGIADAIEDIKDEYFNGILHDGILGASPLFFPYTSPNALAAQASIAFDLRGESITFPVENSFEDVIKYATECIAGGHTTMAIAGVIRLKDKKLSLKDGRYQAEFFLIEEESRAMKRGAKIYHSAWEELHEDF